MNVLVNNPITNTRFLINIHGFTSVSEATARAQYRVNKWAASLTQEQRDSLVRAKEEQDRARDRQELLDFAHNERIHQSIISGTFNINDLAKVRF